MNGENRLLMVATAFGFACLSAFFAGAATVTGESGPTAVDTTSGAKFSGGSAALAYAPAYSDATASDTCYVVLKKVFDFGTTLATTSTVVQCEAGTAGDYAFSVGASDSHRVTLLHTLYDADDQPMGETLVADVVLPLASAANAVAASVDCRADSLQLVADEAAETKTKVELPFAYDSKWTTNGVPVRFELKQVCDSVNRNMEVVASETNILAQAEVPAAGDYVYNLNPAKGGRFTFFCTFYDSTDKVVGETYSASYYLKENCGMAIIVR